MRIRWSLARFRVNGILSSLKVKAGLCWLHVHFQFCVVLLAIQSLHEPRRSLFFDVHTLCVGGERLAVVHHYIYIYSAFTFDLHAHLVVVKMCVTIPCREITSRRLAALTTSPFHFVPLIWSESPWLAACD